MVYLEVARMHDDAQRGAHRDAHGVRYRVADAEEFDAQAPYLEGGVGLHDVEAGVLEQAVLTQLDGDQAVGEPRAVYGHVQLGQHVGQRPDVVFVAVRDQYGLQLVAVLDEVGDVRDDEVDARHALLGEEHAGVDDDHLAVVLQGHHVLAYFAKPP